MKKNVLLILASFLLLAPSLCAQTTTTPPPIPEEARRHFVMGETMFKEAKAPGDFVLAEGEFKQATDLAPQWPDACYNLALAKEAAGDFPGAMADLKLYQQFKLNDAEARTAQDKMYALEAKQKMAVDAANSPAGKARTSQHQFPALIQKLDGAVFTKQDNDADLSWHHGNPTLHELRFSRSGPNNLLMCQLRIKQYQIEPYGKYEYEWRKDLHSDEYVEPTHAGMKDGFFYFADTGDDFFIGCNISGRLSPDGKTLQEVGLFVKTLEVRGVWQRQ